MISVSRVLCLCVLVLSLASCADRRIAPYVSIPATEPARATQSIEVLTITGRDQNEAGFFVGHRADTLSFVAAEVSIPPNHKPGRIEASYFDPDPRRHFVIGGENRLPDENTFRTLLRSRLTALPKKDREIVLFLHGYNTSYTDGLFRVAQLKHDLEIPGLAMHFSWPSAANPLGYSHDRDSVLEARDDLEAVLRMIRKTTNTPVLIVAHSMGSLLVMEALRQIEIASPGWSEPALAGVLLISPDLSIDVFRGQASRFKALPQPFAIFTSRRDPALLLSSRVNGVTERLGNLQTPSALGDLPVTLVDVTHFSKQSRDRHFVAGTSPALIRLLTRSDDLENAFRQDRSGRAGLLPGTAITLNKATQLILSPNLILR